MNYRLLIGFFLVFISCKEVTSIDKPNNEEPYVFVLGVAQDAGYPQAGCNKECCTRVYKEPSLGRFVSSIAIVDPSSEQYWVIDATPDFPKQLNLLNDHTAFSYKMPDGIFLTHAHIGHYTGLMHLGREVMNAREIPVNVMPRMKTFLEENGPWSQLVNLNNIALNVMTANEPVRLNDRISITPVLVPHRDEYTETVGFEIKVGTKNVLFIPDIDKWNKWEQPIVDYIKKVDYALLDATFFKDGEIKGRAMADIPHPFVQESMELFNELNAADKSKVYFTHFNHTNPLLIDGSRAQEEVLKNGFQIAKQGMLIK